MSGSIDWAPPTTDADTSPQKPPQRPGRIVVHDVVQAGLEQAFPGYGLVPGRALCGFVFTPANEVTMSDRAAEGEQHCRPCDVVLLAMRFEAS